MPEWSIRIVPVDPARAAGSAAFQPQNGSPGQPLATWDGDLVTWNNTTDAVHQPWPTDSTYTKPASVNPGDLGYMSDEIPPRQGSRPTYSVNLPSPPPTELPYIVYYYCAKHPDDLNERGTIQVIPPPTS